MKSFSSFDGTRIAYDEAGHGSPVVLVHGFAASGDINWVRSIAAEKEDETEVAPPPQTDSLSSLKTIVDGSLQTISH